MSDPGTDLASILRLHPRMAQQNLAPPERRVELAAHLPALVPFSGASYQGLLAVLDWDHRLPSRATILRVYAYYSSASLARGDEAYRERLAAIEKANLFPEFDVPDFSELEADEAYEFDLHADGSPREARLVSPWRHEIEDGARRRAVEAVVKSKEFAAVRKRFRRRPANLGGPEAVQWSAPCESGQPFWTVDVWYLLALEGTQGSGRSFLVSVEDGRVVATREFVVQLS